MTVGDLIEILQQYPLDTEVFVDCEGDDCKPDISYNSSEHSIVIW